MTISVVAAFFGGLLSLLSPCSAMVLPTFAAAGMSQRRKLLVTTLVFSLGLFVVLFPLGLGALKLWQWLFFYRRPLSLVVGVGLLLAAILVILGRQLPFPNLIGWVLPQKKPTGKYATVFSLGLVSGLGSSACVGPILGAIVTLAASATNPIGTTLLMASYAAGLVAPLFGLSLVYERYDLANHPILRGKILRIGSLRLHSHNLATGSLLLLVSYIFLRYQGSLGFSPIFTRTGLLELYLDLQEKLFLL